MAALGVTDQHSQVQLYIEGPNDKVFTFWAREEILLGRQDSHAQFRAGASTLWPASRWPNSSMPSTAPPPRRLENGRPNCTITLDRVDEEHLGAFLQLMEFQTAFMGELLDINAFDQEGVELGKKFTYGLMGRAGFEKYRRQFTAYEKKRKGL